MADKRFSITVNQKHEVINGLIVSRSISLTIGDHEPIVMNKTELRQLYNTISNIISAENELEECINADDKNGRNYADEI